MSIKLLIIISITGSEVFSLLPLWPVFSEKIIFDKEINNMDFNRKAKQIEKKGMSRGKSSPVKISRLLKRKDSRKNKFLNNLSYTHPPTDIPKVLNA